MAWKSKRRFEKAITEINISSDDSRKTKIKSKTGGKKND